MATPAGLTRWAKVAPDPDRPGRWTFSARIPREADGGLYLIARVRWGDRIHHARMALPVTADRYALEVTADPAEAPPRATVNLSFRMPRPPADPDDAPTETGENPDATLSSGAACVVVADASILARASGVTPESEALDYLRQRALDGGFRQAVLNRPRRPTIRIC